MARITVGLPKGLLYYRYHMLWKAFFDALEVPYITSDESHLAILDAGKKVCVDEACLSLKLYMGHIASLQDKCDYILIPRIFSLEKTEQVCTNFNCLYDLTHTLFPNLNILHYNIDVKRRHKEKSGFIKIGKELGFSMLEANRAYLLAKEVEKNYQLQQSKRAEEKLASSHLKILLLGHPYNLEDAMIGKRITNYLKESQIDIIYSHDIPKKQVDIYSKKISPRVHWTMNKELLAAFMYYKDRVDGIIAITAFPCGPDSLTNEMILRKRGTSKVLLLTFEDLSSDVAVMTRLESFLDMLKGGIHL